MLSTCLPFRSTKDSIAYPTADSKQHIIPSVVYFEILFSSAYSILRSNAVVRGVGFVIKTHPAKPSIAARMCLAPILSPRYRGDSKIVITGLNKIKRSCEPS